MWFGKTSGEMKARAKDQAMMNRIVLRRVRFCNVLSLRSILFGERGAVFYKGLRVRLVLPYPLSEHGFMTSM